MTKINDTGLIRGAIIGMMECHYSRPLLLEGLLAVIGYNYLVTFCLSRKCRVHKLCFDSLNLTSCLRLSTRLCLRYVAKQLTVRRNTSVINVLYCTDALSAHLQNLLRNISIIL